jgi:hypothetical protein
MARRWILRFLRWLFPAAPLRLRREDELWLGVDHKPR